MDRLNLYVVIMAAGRGERAGGDVPKQFRRLLGLPIYLHSVYTFARAVDTVKFAIVTPPSAEWDDEVKKCMNEVGYDYIIVHGGGSRCESVDNALEALNHIASGHDMVAIHDGARPLVTTEMIKRGLQAAASNRGCCAVPCVAVTDTIRHISPSGSSSVIDRSQLRAVQTPQIAVMSEIMAVYERGRSQYGTLANAPYTDDASLFEARDADSIVLYDGESSNIKITTPEDFAIAETLLSIRKR